MQKELDKRGKKSENETAQPLCFVWGRKEKQLVHFCERIREEKRVLNKKQSQASVLGVASELKDIFLLSLGHDNC